MMIVPNRSRPVRLVMINSGKFSYGEINLSSPVHLVGQNNVGKTTLISTLQFLYIDNQNQMNFSRAMDETRRYYFPDMKSFILFECLASSGYMVMGVRGLGVLKRNEFERFIYRGPYEKKDFIDPETGEIRSFEDIARDLSSRDYTPLKPSELRDSLTGTGRNRAPVLGIVPVKNRNDYDKFKKIFRNLLHLAHLSQEELKKFLIDVNSSDLKRTEVDLAKDFSDGYKKVQRNARTLSDLKLHSETARKVLELHNRRTLIDKELPPLYSAMTESVKSKNNNLGMKIDDLSSSLNGISTEEKRLKGDLGSLSGKIGELQRKAGHLEGKLEDFSKLEQSVANYMDEFEASSIAGIRSKLTQVQIALRDAEEGDRERTGRRIVQSEEEYTRLSERLKNIEKLAVSSLPEFSSNAVSALRLFNERLLSLPHNPEGIEFNNVDKFLARLEYLGSRIEEDFYNDDSISISLSSVPEPDLNTLTDRKALVRKITDLRDLLERERRVLKAIEERLNLQKENEKLEKELKEREARRNNWQRYIQTREPAALWQSELDQVEAEREQLAVEQKDIQRKLTENEEHGKSLEKEKDGEQNCLKRLIERASRIPQPEESWLMAEVLETERDAFELIDIFSEKFNKRNSISLRIRDNLSVLETATCEEYMASDEAAALKKLQEDIDAIEEKEEALKKLWSGLASDVSQALKSLLSSLDTLKEKVNRLNNRLAKVSVSDLKQLKLVLVENKRWTRLVRTGMEADEMPLFSDRTQVEKALESMGNLLETVGGGRIELRDMFNLSFEILDVTGRIRKFGRLENIESNGTTITIKVLVNLILLKDLLSTDKAQIPFYLDEASSLDRDNLASVVDTAFAMGFPAVLASPEAMDVASRIYMMKDIGGRVFLDPEMSCIEVNRYPDGGNDGNNVRS